jgi:hypothetical protein
VRDGGGVLGRQPAEIPAGERAAHEVGGARELAVEVKEHAAAARQRRVHQRRRIARRHALAILACGDRAPAREIRVRPVAGAGHVRQVVDEVTRAAVDGLAGEGPRDAALRRLDRRDDRVAGRERAVHVAAGVRGEVLREARLEKEALADDDLGGIGLPFRRLLRPDGDRRNDGGGHDGRRRAHAPLGCHGIRIRRPRRRGSRATCPRARRRE